MKGIVIQNLVPCVSMCNSLDVTATIPVTVSVSVTSPHPWV